MAADPLPKLRALCLALPMATEKEAWGAPTFRAGTGKLFAMYAPPNEWHPDRRPQVWIKSTPTNQELVIDSDPDRYFSPPYVGPSGWIGAYLDRRPPWAAITELLEDGYRQVATKKLLALLNAPAAPPATPRRRSRG